MKNVLRMKLGGALVLAGALLTNTAPAQAQDYGNPGFGNPGPYNYQPAGQLDNLVSRIALYPDPLLAQIFAASAFPDQVAAAAQGSPGPFDPSVEALRQYPSVLQMMANDPDWVQALGDAVMQDEGAVMDAVQNLRRQAQQYGYLQSGPQMQVVDEGGYIDIMPVGGYMYVPVYDPYVVFARPRPGFFVGGAIRFGGGFYWAGGYNRFNWRNHELFVNRRVWTPPMRRAYPTQRFNEQRRYEDYRGGFRNGSGNWNRNSAPPADRWSSPQRNYTAPQQQPRDFGRQWQQRTYTAPQQQPREFNRPAMEQRNFTPPQRSFTPQQQPMQQRNFPAPQQRMQNRGFTPQNGGHFERGGEGRGRGR